MKTLTFNKNSIHYKLAELGGFSRWQYYDICSYTRTVLAGALLTCLLGVLFTMISTLVIHMLLGVFFSLWYGRYIFTQAGEIGGIVIIIAFLFSFFFVGLPLACRACKDRLTRHKWVERQTRPDGFIKSAYKSHKEKYCVRIEFK